LVTLEKDEQYRARLDSIVSHSNCDCDEDLDIWCGFIEITYVQIK
jgi:hypothetical protein